MQLNKINVDHFKESIRNEKLVTLNFDYLSPLIENWWDTTIASMPLYLAKFQLIHLILKHCKQEHFYYFDKLGISGISAICITQIFHTDCHKLSFVVHEALSELFALNDINYPYENHKKLYLKENGIHYKDWGNGYGEITPHSDDLYEDIDADFLSLTVCRDITNTPTICYFPKDILHNFSDEELQRLFEMKARFVSGKNVLIRKTRERNVIEFNPSHGYKFYLDFRIDNDSGERMLPVNENDRDLIDKMRSNIALCPYIEPTTKTGSFLIVANHKVLHARGPMQMNKESAATLSQNSDYSIAPRLLYRSKGQVAKHTY